MKQRMISIFIVFLLIMNPFVIAQQTTPTAPTTTPTTSTKPLAPLQLDVTIPSFAPDKRIDLIGTATPWAKVEILVNGESKRTLTVPEDGVLKSRNVPLSKDENVIDIILSRGVEKLAKRGSIALDLQPPKVNITIPKFSKEAPLIIKGTVSEPGNLSVFVVHGADRESPSQVEKLKNRTITEAGVDLVWEPVSEKDVQAYLIYRNGKRIAVVREKTDYIDLTASIGKEYEYQITALDKTCNEGPKSSKVKAKKTTGQTFNEPSEITLQSLACPVPQLSYVAKEGAISVQLDIQPDVPNYVEINFKDKGGHTATFTETVKVDTQPPIIQSNLLDVQGPAFIPEISVRGNSNEPVSITVFVNNKPVKIEKTKADGSFDINVQLKRETQVNVTQKRFALEAGSGYKNQIRIEAIDEAGHMTKDGPVDVVYSFCGEGGPFRIVPQILAPEPGTLVPRILMTQLAQAVVAFNVTYTGTLEYRLNPLEIKLMKVDLSPEFAKEYDNDWVDLYTVVQESSPKSYAGYSQILFSHVPMPASNTTLANERNLSSHRKGEADIKTGSSSKSRPFVARKGCIAPGFGCAKLYLLMEIPYQELRSFTPLPGAPTSRIPGEPVPLNKIQKQCIEMEFMIDEPIPRDKIPNKFLNKSVEFLGDVIESIDVVLKPLETVNKYLVFSCGVGPIVGTVLEVRELFACDLESYFGKVKQLAGGGKAEEWDPDVARAGLCHTYYDPSKKDDDDTAYDECMECSNAFENIFDFQWFYQQICDRIYCPSAPTLQRFIKETDAELKELPKVTKNIAITKLGQLQSSGEQTPEELDALREGLPVASTTDILYFGSDCAAWVTENKKEIGENKFIGYTTTSKLYKEYLDVIEGSSTTGKKALEKYCSEPHPATSKCCGYEYMTMYGSACGLGQGGLFDEIEKSACLSASQVGQGNPDVGQHKVDCGGIFGLGKAWNAISGFCEPNTFQPTPEFIKVGTGEAFKEKRDIYIIIKPRGQKNTVKNALGYTAQQPTAFFDIYLGYVRDTFIPETKEETAGKLPAASTNDYLNPKKESLKVKDLSKHFTSVHVDNFRKDGSIPPGFIDDVWKTTSSSGGWNFEAGVKPEEAKEVYGRVVAKIGDPEQQYIVQPSSGFLRSIQCVCLPGIQAYLQKYKSIANALRNCFMSILSTGDGDPGLCQAALSTQVCDLMFEVLSCASQWFFGGSPDRGITVRGKKVGGASGFFEKITTAGARSFDHVQNRYGQTSMWNSMFNQQKLMNSICAFAFTGTWDLDISAMADQAIDSIPIESSALITRCERRFQGVDIFSQPPGKVLWLYRMAVAVAAGADVNTQLYLKCSRGYRCTAADQNGVCDCERKGGEKTDSISPPEWPLRIAKNDFKSAEIFFPAQAYNEVRYDRAVLEISWEDSGTKQQKVQKSECEFSLVGGGAPSYCSWDALNGMFRCKFGETPFSVSITNAVPKYSYVKKTTGEGVFLKGMDLEFDVTIKRQLPDDPREKNKPEHIRYLGWKVYNQNGAELMTVTPENSLTSTHLRKVEGEGDVPVNVLLLVENLNNKHFETGRQATGGMSLTAWFSKDKKTGSSDLIKSFNILGTNTPSIPFIYFEFKKDKFNIHETRSSAPSATGFSSARALASDIDTNHCVQQICQVDLGTQASAGIAGNVMMASYQFSQLPQVQAGDIIQVLVPVMQVGVPPKDPCTPDSGKQAVDNYVTWRAIFTVYDSEKNTGMPSKTVSYDSIKRKQATLEIPFKVACAEDDPQKNPNFGKGGSGGAGGGTGGGGGGGQPVASTASPSPSPTVSPAPAATTTPVATSITPAPAAAQPAATATASSSSATSFSIQFQELLNTERLMHVLPSIQMLFDEFQGDNDVVIKAKFINVKNALDNFNNKVLNELKTLDQTKMQTTQLRDKFTFHISGLKQAIEGMESQYISGTKKTFDGVDFDILRLRLKDLEKEVGDEANKLRTSP